MWGTFARSLAHTNGVRPVVILAIGGLIALDILIVAVALPTLIWALHLFALSIEEAHKCVAS